MMESILNILSQVANAPHLTLLIFFPLFAILILSFIPKHKHNVLKRYALIIFIIEALFSLILFLKYQNTGISHSFMLKIAWIEQFKIDYYVGIDSLSLLLILLTTFTMPLALIATWNSITKQLKFYFMCLLFLETGIIGVFSSLDLFLFYLFWEIMLVPMYFIIGIWGGKDRVYATLKFFIYTMAGSVIMLVAIIYLYFKSGQTLNLFDLYSHRLPFSTQYYLFFAFVFAFAIKVPLFPLHTWLPDAHVQAPTVGSVILASILLKMGAYGFFRLAIPLFPEIIYYFQFELMTLAIIGIVYGALLALIQTNIKKLIAYSSISHMGLVMLGLFSLSKTGMTGGILQIFNHGIATGGLFLLAGMLYKRTNTLTIKDYSGMAKTMPLFSFFFFIITLASIGLPLTGNFVGEFITLTSIFSISPLSGIIASTGIVLGAVYMLWLFERVFLGSKKIPQDNIAPLKGYETAVLIIITVLIFWIGIYPKPMLTKIESGVTHILDQVNKKEINKI